MANLLTLPLATEHSQEIAREVPNAELLVVEDANHSVHLEKNELVLKKMAEFLAK
jgi:pimeloyl-ACP methyl ester carboxylesterase